MASFFSSDPDLKVENRKTHNPNLDYNHLDSETQKLIGENFHEFEGTILMVSHNPAFAEAVGITRMLDRRVKLFPIPMIC